MPTAVRSPWPIPASASASPATAWVTSQISRASCSTQPGLGNDGVISRVAWAMGSARSSKTKHVVAVVPWSIARIMSGASLTRHLAHCRSGERVSHFDGLEAPKAAISGVDRADAVLAHERRQVRIGYERAANAAGSGRSVEVEESGLLARRANMRSFDQVDDRRKRRVGGVRVCEDPGARRDPQEAHDRRPEEKQE